MPSAIVSGLRDWVYCDQEFGGLNRLIKQIVVTTPALTTSGSLSDLAVVRWLGWDHGSASTTTITTADNCSNAWTTWNVAYDSAYEKWDARLRAEYTTQRAAELAAQVALTDTRQLERERARECAEALLLSNLDAEQVKQFKANRMFVVQSADRQRHYRVEYGMQGNIRLLDSTGRPLAKFCIHPDEICPVEDVMLAQKLMIETDEKLFLKIANRTALVAA